MYFATATVEKTVAKNEQIKHLSVPDAKRRPNRNSNCLGKIKPLLIEHCSSRNTCIISRREPKWVESKYNLCAQFPKEELRNLTEIDCACSMGETGFSAFFPCVHAADLGFTGIIYDFFKDRTKQTSDTMCVYTDACSFNEVAEIVADWSQDNTKGIGQNASLVYAGFLLYSILRGIQLKLASSPPLATSKVVLMGLVDQDRGWTPLQAMSKIVSWEVWYILAFFFAVWVVVAFLIGGDSKTLPRDPAEDWRGVFNLAWQHFWSIRFTPSPTPEDRGTFDRLNVYRCWTRLMLLALAGALLLFEGVLLIAPPPINKLGEPLENSIKQGKVYLVQNTALMDGMVLYFDDLKEHFKGCASFSACTDLVASEEGIYFISLETVAASSINSEDRVVPYDTAESLNFFEGVFFYSSSVTQDFQLDLNNRLFRAKMDRYFERREEVHSLRPSKQSEETDFGWELLLIGMGVPVAIVAGMASALLALCMAHQMSKFLIREVKRTLGGLEWTQRSSSTYWSFSDESLSDESSSVGSHSV